MVKALDCGILESEFELQSRYYVHFRTNTLGKGMKALILRAMKLNSDQTRLSKCDWPSTTTFKSSFKGKKRLFVRSIRRIRLRLDVRAWQAVWSDWVSQTVLAKWVVAAHMTTWVKVHWTTNIPYSGISNHIQQVDPFGVFCTLTIVFILHTCMHLSLSLSLSIYIYIYIYVCVTPH